MKSQKKQLTTYRICQMAEKAKTGLNDAQIKLVEARNEFDTVKRLIDSISEGFIPLEFSEEEQAQLEGLGFLGNESGESINTKDVGVILATLRTLYDRYGTDGWKMNDVIPSLEGNPNSMRARINYLMVRGFLKRLGHGIYHVTSDGVEAINE